VAAVVAQAHLHALHQLRHLARVLRQLLPASHRRVNVRRHLGLLLAVTAAELRRGRGCGEEADRSAKHFE